MFPGDDSNAWGFFWHYEKPLALCEAAFLNNIPTLWFSQCLLNLWENFLISKGKHFSCIPHRYMWFAVRGKKIYLPFQWESVNYNWLMVVGGWKDKQNLVYKVRGVIKNRSAFLAPSKNRQKWLVVGSNWLLILINQLILWSTAEGDLLSPLVMMGQIFNWCKSQGAPLTI